MLRRILLPILAMLVGVMMFAPVANAALFPIKKTKITSTSVLQSGLKDRSDVLQSVVANTGGGKASAKDFVFCGKVTSSQRAKLASEGYKNTAYDANGNIVRLGALKSGPMIWACRVDTKAIEKDLKKKLKGGVKLKCVEKTYKSGTITVVCKGEKRTYTVHPPVRRVPIGEDCLNEQKKSGPITYGSISNMWTAWSTITVKKGETIVCPGGASATATATAKARGFGYGKTMSAAKKMAKKNASASVSVSGSCTPPTTPPLTCEQTGTCPTPTTPPPPPPADVCPNLPGVQVTLPDGFVLSAEGCVRPKSYAKATATARANVSVECPGGTTVTVSVVAYGVGEAWADSYEEALKAADKAARDDADAKLAYAKADAYADADVKVKCGGTPPPPPETCPDGRPVPPEGCDRAPQVDLLKPAHLFTESAGVYGYAKGYDPDGDTISMLIEATGAASAGGTVSYPRYYDGEQNAWVNCQVNWKCFRAQLFTGQTPGQATLIATATAGGKKDTASLSFPVEADKGWS